MNNSSGMRISTNMLFVLTIAALLWIVTGCGGRTRTPQQVATIEAESTLTAAHESEVRSMIENYYMVSGSLDANRDPGKLSQVATGPLLELLLSAGAPRPGTSLYVTRSVEIEEVHVLDYTPSQVKAIGCGLINLDLVTFEGQSTESLPASPLLNIYVFVQEGGTWKLFTHYYFGDPDEALRDWEYVSEEERQAIGDLEDYIDMYFGCGVIPTRPA